MISPSASTPLHYLARAIARRRVPHALLFAGPSPMARESAATSLARALLCETGAGPTTIESPGGEPQFGCGDCSSCRRVASGNHPDLHVVAADAELQRRGRPVTNPDGKPSREIRIEQIRTLTRALRQPAFEGRARVAMIVDAHRMNDNAANGLLKTLEEPGQDAFLILLVPHERAVLPTIASRSARLRFPPAGTSPSDGAVVGETREGPNVDALLRLIVETSSSRRLQLIDDIGRDREDTLLLIDTATEAILNATRAAVHAGSRNVDLLGTPISRRHCVDILDNLVDVRASIERNGHVQIVLEEFAFLHA